MQWTRTENGGRRWGALVLECSDAALALVCTSSETPAQAGSTTVVGQRCYPASMSSNRSSDFALMARWVGAGMLCVVVSGASGCQVDGGSGDGPQFFQHCGDLSGDATCRNNYLDEVYCDLCVPASIRQGCAIEVPAPACRPEGVAGTGELDDGADESTGGTTSGADASTTGASSSGGSDTGFVCAVDGDVDPECESIDAGRPYCVDGTCSSCREAPTAEFCSSLSASTPACSNETGRCVPCDEGPEDFTCKGKTPVCDSDTGACVGCATHDECASGACHLDPVDPDFGSCFGQDQVVYVDADSACPGAGTQVSPRCSLEAVLSEVSTGDDVVLRVDGQGTRYREAPELVVDATVAIIGANEPELAGSGSEPGLSVPIGRVYLSGVRLEGTQTHGLVCANATVYADRIRSTANEGYGVFTDGPCDLQLRRSVIDHNLQGGVRALGGRLLVSNTGIGLNGDGLQGPGLNVQFNQLEVVYATILGNDATGADSIQCLESTGRVRNSIVLGNGSPSIEIGCSTGLIFTHDAVDTLSYAGETGRLVNQAYVPNWFVSIEDGDFRLAAPPLTPFGDLALWEEGDPTTDIEGTARPTDGTLGYVGLDQPDS